MKARMPQDVERLMWMVAESNDQKAIQDFESRFPEFASELSKRRRMVSELKGAKSTHVPDARIPDFRLRGEPKVSSPKGMWVVGGIAFAALLMASYSVTKMVNTPPTKLPVVEPVVTKPIENPNTTVYTNPTPVPNITTPPPMNPPVNPNPAQSGEQLKTLKLSNTSLTAALKMIGEMAGYRVDVAPGFEDQQISIDYVETTTSEMLKDLGMRYGFTAFDQGDGSIIIVPAIDSGTPIGGTGEPPRRLGG